MPDWHTVVSNGPEKYAVDGEDIILHYENGGARIFGCHDRWRRELEAEYSSRAVVQCLMYCDSVKTTGAIHGTLFPVYTPTDEEVPQYCSDCDQITFHSIRRGMVQYKRADCSSLKTRCNQCDHLFQNEIEECGSCGLWSIQRPAPKDDSICSRCGEAGI